MAQLQIPTSIWLSATPDERDRFYLDAGFDPNLPVIDNGTDGSFVRFRQDPPFDATQEGGGDYQPGDDMRDPPTVVVPTAIPVPVPPLTALDVGVIPVVGALSVAGRSLRLIMTGGGGRLLAATWNSLPPVSRAALAQVGIGIGTIVAFRGDIPFIDVSREVNNGIVPFDAGSEGGASIPGIVDIQIGANPLQPVQVVGTWVANGVTR